jgi:hypothetical protein
MWCSENFNSIDSEEGARLSFFFNKSYEEDILVHDQFGGNRIGINCLSRLKFTDEFKNQILSSLLPLKGKSYIAIQVRHTDYQTNYEYFFEQIYEKTINKRVLICSDSVEVIKFANNFFDKSEFLALNLPPDTGGIGLATYATFHCNENERYELMIKAFSDLFILATASEVIYSKLTSSLT